MDIHQIIHNAQSDSRIRMVVWMSYFLAPKFCYFLLFNQCKYTLLLVLPNITIFNVLNYVLLFVCIKIGCNINKYCTSKGKLYKMVEHIHSRFNLGHTSRLASNDDGCYIWCKDKQPTRATLTNPLYSLVNCTKWLWLAVILMYDVQWGWNIIQGNSCRTKTQICYPRFTEKGLVSLFSQY